jgi:hypothetical protein
MNFGATYDYLVDGKEWCCVRTKTHSYARWLNGKRILYDIQMDPLQMHNLIDKPETKSLADGMETTLTDLMDARNDKLQPATSYTNWYDTQRCIVRNTYGPLGDPEDEPDWSLLKP